MAMMNPNAVESVGGPPRAAETVRPDDRFVPLVASDLVKVLAADTAHFGCDAAGMPGVADALRKVITAEVSTFERELYDRYAHVNPDRDTLVLADLDTVRTPEFYADLDRRLGYLLDKANFERLSDGQIRAAVVTANSYGLRVRLEAGRVEALSVWVRGRSSVTRHRRTARAPWHGVSRVLEVYRRLAVVVRLKNDPHVVLKLFKNIPIEDVEALLPHAEVTMTWFDRFVVFGSGAGTVGSMAGKILSAAAFGKLLWAVAVAMGTLAVHTILGYRRTRKIRDSQRTTHLYYQNLNNNAGVIHSLVAMIVQEELKEAILGYAFGRVVEEHREVVLARPAETIDAYVKEKFGVHVDFDMDDAAETITRLGLWEDRAKYRSWSPCGSWTNTVKSGRLRTTTMAERRESQRDDTSAEVSPPRWKRGAPGGNREKSADSWPIMFG